MPTTYAEGRLTARPGGDGAAQPGLHHLHVDDEPAGLLYVPRQPTHLAVTFHGAGGTDHQGMALLRPYADAAALAVLAPDSADLTWDAVRDGFGPDLRRVDALLAQAFARLPGVAVALAGFSDGASYALSLGLANGDLAPSVVAFSPGFFRTGAARGRPRFFVTHGVHDGVLPIARCARRVVHELRGAGYQVDYHEFDDGHVVPPDLAAEAAAWITAPPDAPATPRQ